MVKNWDAPWLCDWFLMRTASSTRMLNPEDRQRTFMDYCDDKPWPVYVRVIPVSCIQEFICKFCHCEGRFNFLQAFINAFVFYRISNSLAGLSELSCSVVVA